MGQQQLLLLILGVVIVGIAIAVGIGQFGSHNIQANKEGVTASLVSVSADAYQYKLRPSSKGGGGGSYLGYTVPSKLSQDDYGTYALNGSPTAHLIVFQGKSAFDATWIATCTVDSAGRTTMVYSGW